MRNCIYYINYDYKVINYDLYNKSSKVDTIKFSKDDFIRSVYNLFLICTISSSGANVA